jgi:sugar transferase EpsL
MALTSAPPTRSAASVTSRSAAVKRSIDVVGACVGLVLASPALIGIVGLEVLLHGWPPIFTQSRPGLHGKIFTLRKFRTMTDARDEAGRLLPDAERLTRFGRMLRASSLDELPELINVLVGEMSLVGPRPLLVQYLDRYSEEQARRHDVKPGLTGWAQINGRNALTWEQKLALDVWYVDNWSVGLDLKIMLKTITAVLSRSGINAADSVTMPEFMGSVVTPAGAE